MRKLLMAGLSAAALMLCIATAPAMAADHGFDAPKECTAISFGDLQPDMIRTAATSQKTSLGDSLSAICKAALESNAKPLMKGGTGYPYSRPSLHAANLKVSQRIAHSRLIWRQRTG